MTVGTRITVGAKMTVKKKNKTLGVIKFKFKLKKKTNKLIASFKLRVPHLLTHFP